MQRRKWFYPRWVYLSVVTLNACLRCLWILVS
jgi:hypothetical protein